MKKSNKDEKMVACPHCGGIKKRRGKCPFNCNKDNKISFFDYPSVAFMPDSADDKTDSVDNYDTKKFIRQPNEVKISKNNCGKRIVA